MAIEIRPTVNTFTANHAFVGLPFVEFSKETSPGVFDPYVQLGIIDSAELTKTVELLTMRSFQSGLGSIVRELVGSLEARLNVGLFQFDEGNLQMFLGSSINTVVGAATPAVTDDAFQVPSTFPNGFTDLTNRAITTEPLTDLDPQAIVGEAVGSGQGSPFGETAGDFALAFPIDAGDVAASVVLYHDGVDVTGAPGFTLVVGAATAPGEIGLVEGAVATSGEIDYWTGEGPADGVVITADYTPTFTMVNGTDYILDLTEGRIRMLDTDMVKAGQTLLADYTYTRAAHNLLNPFTQTTFAGRARVKQLTDVGVNFIWTIPKASVRITDDAFAWASDDFARGNLIINLLNDGTSAPYGGFQLFDETP